MMNMEMYNVYSYNGYINLFPFKSNNDEILTSYKILEGLEGKLMYKIVISSFDVLQIGDLAAQMTLQGHKGMASCRCIKCDLTQNEWKLGYVPKLLNINDINKALPNDQ